MPRTTDPVQEARMLRERMRQAVQHARELERELAENRERLREEADLPVGVDLEKREDGDDHGA